MQISISKNRERVQFEVLQNDSLCLWPFRHTIEERERARNCLHKLLDCSTQLKRSKVGSEDRPFKFGKFFFVCC